MAACRECRFWDCPANTRGRVPGAFNDALECLRRAPQAGKGNFRYGEWPRTFPGDWCGDFEPLPVADEADKG